MNYRDIAGIFAEIELKLIASLKRNLAPHKAWEKREGFVWTAWQAQKINNLEQFRRENKEIVDDYTNVIDQETEMMLREQFAEGEELKHNPPKPDSISEEHFFGVNESRLNKLIEDTLDREHNAQSAALRMMDDVYRQTIIKTHIAMGAGAVTLPQAVDIATKDFLRAGINCIEYANGRRVNIADYVQMALRTAATRSYLQGEAHKRDALGIDTVLVSQYGACSETCLPWQGRVYVDDVWGAWSGERSGDRGRSTNGKWYPLLSVAVKNGLFHPNCRHTVSTWYDGVSASPEPPDEKTVKENAKLEQRQRGLEREVRKWKRMEAGTQDPKTRALYRKRTREAQKDLRIFVAEHSDVLRREYWREKVYGETTR